MGIATSSKICSMQFEMPPKSHSRACGGAWSLLAVVDLDGATEREERLRLAEEASLALAFRLPIAVGDAVPLIAGPSGEADVLASRGLSTPPTTGAFASSELSTRAGVGAGEFNEIWALRYLPAICWFRKFDTCSLEICYALQFSFMLLIELTAAIQRPCGLSASVLSLSCAAG